MLYELFLKNFKNRIIFLLSLLQLDFVHPRDPQLLTFGEFLEFFYTFCLFEPLDMMRFVFKMFDTESTGFVDKDEIRHFIYMLHETKDNATIEQGLNYLEDNDDGDGRFEFYQIRDMHFRFQILFYPAFRLITQMRRTTLGESWWESKNFERQDDRDTKKLIAAREAAAKSKKDAEAAEMANDDLVKRRMGIKYYLMPWERRKVRFQIARIAAIDADLGGDDVETGAAEENKNEQNTNAPPARP